MNNVGVVRDKLVIKMKIEDFYYVIDNNFILVFIGCREVLKVMSKSCFGSVVNIVFIIGERGNMG